MIIKKVYSYFNGFRTYSYECYDKALYNKIMKTGWIF